MPVWCPFCQRYTLGTTITPHYQQLLKSQPTDTELNSARLEFYVYRQLYYALDNGRAYCNDSFSFADLEQDLVEDALVDQAAEIGKTLGYPDIADYCGARLDALVEDVEQNWEVTNQHIADGSNDYITLKTDSQGVVTDWSLAYPTPIDDNDTVFFDSVQQIDALDLLKLMGDILNLWSYFKPFKEYYIKHRVPEPLLLIGCILAEALGFGIKVMSKMSNVSFNQLQTIDENFLYVENLRHANDVVSNYIHRQPISRVWDLLANEIIGDADGQKYQAKYDTLQSRYSAKYFGTYKGISVYTLTANHIAINAKTIGPNEYEGHHLYDILYNNTH